MVIDLGLNGVHSRTAARGPGDRPDYSMGTVGASHLVSPKCDCYSKDVGWGYRTKKKHPECTKNPQGSGASRGLI